MSVKATKPGSVTMAGNISAVVCEHGNLYIRLHNRQGDVFAAACMTKPVGYGLVDQILTEFDAPSAECGGLHS